MIRRRVGGSSWASSACSCRPSSCSSSGCERDGLSTPEKVADAAHLLPPTAETVLLPGANHAAFGDYGPQPGDDTATASDEETRDRVTEAVAGFLSSAQ